MHLFATNSQITAILVLQVTYIHSGFVIFMTSIVTVYNFSLSLSLAANTLDYSCFSTIIYVQFAITYLNGQCHEISVLF